MLDGVDEVADQGKDDKEDDDDDSDGDILLYHDEDDARPGAREESSLWGLRGWTEGRCK